MKQKNKNSGFTNQKTSWEAQKVSEHGGIGQVAGTPVCGDQGHDRPGTMLQAHHDAHW